MAGAMGELLAIPRAGNNSADGIIDLPSTDALPGLDGLTNRLDSGVASIAKYWRFHLIAPRTGKLDSIAATCIATAASIPGATKSRYGMPSGCAPPLTSLPRPTPSAVR